MAKYLVSFVHHDGDVITLEESIDNLAVLLDGTSNPQLDCMGNLYLDSDVDCISSVVVVEADCPLYNN